MVMYGFQAASTREAIRSQVVEKPTYQAQLAGVHVRGEQSEWNHNGAKGGSPRPSRLPACCAAAAVVKIQSSAGQLYFCLLGRRGLRYALFSGAVFYQDIRLAKAPVGCVSLAPPPAQWTDKTRAPADATT